MPRSSLSRQLSTRCSRGLADWTLPLAWRCHLYFPSLWSRAEGAPPSTPVRTLHILRLDCSGHSMAPPASPSHQGLRGCVSEPFPSTCCMKPVCQPTPGSGGATPGPWGEGSSQEVRVHVSPPVPAPQPSIESPLPHPTLECCSTWGCVGRGLTLVLSPEGGGRHVSGEEAFLPSCCH